MKYLSAFFSQFLPKEGEFIFLQILRAVAATWVCFYHFTLSPIDKSNVIFTVTGNGKLGVVIFFIVSGYVIFLSAIKNAEKPVNFLINRVTRIYPPYLAAFVLIFCLNLFSIQFTGKTMFELTRMTTIDYVGNVLLISNIFPFPVYINGIFWTLCYEIQFYVFVYFMIVCFPKHYRNLFVAITAIHLFILSMNAAAYYACYSVYFFIGFLIYEVHSKQDNAAIVRSLLVYFFVFAWIQYFQNGNKEYLTGALTGAFVLLVRPSDHIFSRPIFKPILFIGGISYSLYLIHDTIGGRLIHIISQKISLNQITLLLCAAIAFVIVVVCAAVFYQIFERYVTNILRRKTQHQR